MSTKETTTPEFTGWRATFWPIHTFELKKFLPLSLIMFCLLFNYTILRDTKDTLVVNSSGAAAITFLKLYCVTPAAIIFVMIYAKLTNILKRENVFYAIVFPFVIFFGVFGFILYPNLDLMHPSTATVQSMHAAFPRLGGFIDIYAFWGISLFYVMSEIWGSAMIALMFWQFANYVVKMSESKRFYGLFGVIANLALILSGQVVGVCSGSYIQQFFATKEEAWHVSMYLLMASVVVFGLIAMGLYRWMHTSVLNDKKYFDPETQGVKKKKKEKPSLMESVKLIFSSPELGLIAILIMAYGVTINLIEVQWKHQLGQFYPDKADYNWFMGMFSTVTGIVTILFGLFIGSNILRKVSWFTAAAITPIIISVGGVCFFLFIFTDQFINLVQAHIAEVSAVTAATFLGATIVIFSKSVKYILFDSTKEMAYIPLSDELKTKGKAAVDVIGGRAGKAGGAFTQSTLFILFATKDTIAIAPQAFVVFVTICGCWFVAVKLLSRKVDEATKRRNDENTSPATA